MFVRLFGGSNIYYETIQVTVYTTGTYIITSSSSMDMYGYLYTGGVIFSNLSLNLLVYDDDSGGNAQFKLVVYLQPNITYILIATTFSGGVTGPFSIFVLGPSRARLLSTNITAATTVSTTQATASMRTSTIPAASTSNFELFPIYIYIINSLSP